jgi:D-alanyl-lipoteichoic acid acyltransferase DltB (MBOAT superfamily)
LLSIGVIFNLGLLGYFKYAGFFVENINHAFDAGFNIPNIILPIGISFFTFQQIAYLFDAHRGKAKEYSFVNYALFVTFFPQLIAGPIVHHKEMMPQFSREFTAKQRWDDFSVGISIFCIGLFKKIIIADTFAIYADAGYGAISAGNALDPASALITVLAYSFQIYYDFSGYTDMAVGLARLFGIQLPVNFHSPYKATGIIDFWRRWHITLSRFFRDYLYIPLGGNQLGVYRTYVNLGCVMLLGGLWHGANWTFIIWGLAHGCLLAMNHAWTSLSISKHYILNTKPAHIFAVMLTFCAVTLAWIPFRAENLDDTVKMLEALFPSGSGVSSIFSSYYQCWLAQFGDMKNLSGITTWFRPQELWPRVLPPDFLATYKPVGLLLVCIGIITFMLPNSNQIFAKFNPVLGLSAEKSYHWASLNRLDWKVALVLSGMFVLSVLQLSRVSPFLYYQF